MTSQTTTRKNTKFILLGLIAAVAVGLLVAKIVIENKIKAWATEDLSLYEPLLKLESAKVEASYLGSSVTYKDLTYSMPDAPNVKFVIEKFTQEGIDGDTLMGKPGDTSTIDKVTISGLRMFVEGVEAPVIEIVRYEIADMAFPYRDIRAALLASKGTNSIVGLFKAMTPIMEKAQMKSGTGSMRGFKINMRQLNFFDLVLGEATSSGFRELNAETDGFDAALDSSEFKNLQITADMPDGSELLSTVESFGLKGLKYNYKEVMAALGQIDKNNDPISLISAVIPSLYNYKFDEATLNKLTVTAMGGVFTLDSINLGPRTLKEQGPNVAKNMRAVFGGMEVFSLEAIGMDKLILSDVIVDFINRPGSYINNPSILAEISKNPFMVLDGTSLGNLYIKNLNANGMVKLDNLAADVDMKGSIKISSKLDKFYASPIALRQAAMFAGGTAQSDFLGVISMNPEGLLLDSVLFTDVSVDDASVGYKVGFKLDAYGQGGLTLNLSGITDEPEYSFQTYGSPLLGSLEVIVTDNGVLDNVFNYLAAKGRAATPEAARADAIQEISQKLTKASKNEAALLDGIKSFIERGGSLNISVNPNQPILFDDLEYPGRSNDIGLSVSNSN